MLCRNVLHSIWSPLTLMIIRPLKLSNNCYFWSAVLWYRIFPLWEKALMRWWESESLCNPLSIFLSKEDHLCGCSSTHWVNHVNLVYLCLVWSICLYFSNNSFFHCSVNAFFAKKEKWTHFPQLKKEKLRFSIREGMEVSHENRNPKSKKSTRRKNKS